MSLGQGQAVPTWVGAAWLWFQAKSKAGRFREVTPF